MALLSVFLSAVACAAPPEAGDRPAAEKEKRSVLRHVGTPLEAVVHLRVTVRDQTDAVVEVREANGVVVRCDGFILIPTAAFAKPRGSANGVAHDAPLKLRGTFTFVPPKEGKAPPPQPVVPPLPFFDEHIGFVMAKVNGWHLPGLPLLSPRNIKPGMAVNVVFARPSKEHSEVAEPVTVSSVVGKPLPDGGRWEFDAKSLPRVPGGAVVVAPGSGTAIGIVAGTTLAGESLPPATEFLTFKDLNRVSNVVALLPRPGDRSDEEEHQDGDEQDGMIWVSGGPVDMAAKSWLRDEGESPDFGFSSRYRTRVACTPGFWIDKYEVANGEYQRFLRATGYPRLPAGWAVVEREHLGRDGEAPVTGVTPDDATAYAEWCGKRLVTPTEWLRATDGTFNQRWMDAWNRLSQIPFLYLSLFHTKLSSELRAQYQVELANLESDRDVPPPVRVRSAPDLTTTGCPFRDAVSAIQRVESHFGFPLVVLRVGDRESDVSRLGVGDALLNVRELLLSNTSDNPLERAPKMIFENMSPDLLPQWKDLLVLRYVRLALGQGELVGEDGKPAQFSPAFGVTSSPPQDWHVNWMLRLDSPAFVLPTPGIGFRCAR
jgi:formylglycine-generating enzyme required for sulfatase activity